MARYVIECLWEAWGTLMWQCSERLVRAHNLTFSATTIHDMTQAVKLLQIQVHLAMFPCFQISWFQIPCARCNGIFFIYILRILSEIVLESFMHSSFWSVNLLIFVEFRKISCCFRMELEDLGLLKNHRWLRDFTRMKQESKNSQRTGPANGGRLRKLSR